MKKKWWTIGIFVVLLIAGILGYQYVARGQSSSSTANLQTATVQRGTLTATLSGAGTVRSGQNAVINWQTSGQVAKVNVKLGDKVQAGQELATLDPGSLPPSMIDAKQTLIDAKKALDELLNSQLQQAQALQAVQDAQKTLDELKQTAAQESAQAQLTLATSQKAVDDAQKKRNAMNYPHSTDDLVIENARTNYLLAKDDYKDALRKFDVYRSKPLTNLDRANALSNLVTAKQKMDLTFATYNWYVQMPTQNEIDQADGELAVAQTNLTKAQTDWDNLKNGPTSVAITLAEATLTDAQRKWEQVKNGPDPDAVAAAQAAVDAAQATLNQEHLVAPFAGTVTELEIKPGDVVTSSAEALRIDDMSAIYIDLQIAEVDVSNMKVGQSADLTFDALPDKKYTGDVTQVGLIGTGSQGVVNYPVTVQISNPDASVTPGMTAAVNIVVAQHDNVLIVPNQAIRVSGAQRNVVVLYEGQQITVPVTTGLTNETMSEITGNVLKEGDEVLINTTTAAAQGNQNRVIPLGGGGFFR